LRTIEAAAGTQFDRRCVSALVELIRGAAAESPADARSSLGRTA